MKASFSMAHPESALLILEKVDMLTILEVMSIQPSRGSIPKKG